MGRDTNVGGQEYVDGSRPKCGSPRLRGMVAKTCKLPHVKEKQLRKKDFKNEILFSTEHYDFKTKI